MDPNAASGNLPGEGGAGSAESEVLLARIEELERQDQEKDNQIRQLLSEKSNVEEARREVSEIREGQRASAEERGQIQAAMNKLQSNDPAEKAEAVAFLLPYYGTELAAAQREIRLLRERQGTKIPDGVPQEIHDAAVEAFENGHYRNLQEAISAKVGDAVLTGKWKPETKPDPATTTTDKQPTAAAPAVRPAPVVRTPVATMTRSRPDAAPALPPEMSETQYLQLPPGQFAEAFKARKAGTLRVNPG